MIIPIRLSRQFLGAIVAVHALSLSAVFLVQASVSTRAILLLLCCVSALLVYRQYRYMAQVSALNISREHPALYRHGRCEPVQSVRLHMFYGQMIVMTLLTDEGDVHLALCSDSCSAGAFRQIKVWLSSSQALV